MPQCIFVGKVDSSNAPANRALPLAPWLLALGFVFSGAIAAAGATPETSPSASHCERTRAVIDIGSGSTKLKVARVDTCLQKIIEVLGPEGSIGSRKVSYKADLKNSPNNEFSAAVMEKGVQAVRELRAIALQMGATEVSGVATAAFREAVNTPQMAKKILAEAEVPVHIVSQKQEALLGYIGVLGTADAPRESILAWDIGGGSMQMTTTLTGGELGIYEGTVAAETFKNAIIGRVQGKDPSKVQSPNPINAEEASSATLIAHEATSEIPAAIRAKAASPETRVFGIGDVHYQSIRKQSGSPDGVITLELLDRAIDSRLGLTDSQIPEKQYFRTEISNLILVRGFMQALDIKRMVTVSASIAEGALVDPEYWATPSESGS